ncbi:hypothetical protein A1O7_03224 [Cladophialophora yegresii CBS 114405]|uniref:Uncharacterized protein n=1 Tax=Cladophialophora yegresii CBS 114405 TaxID=1182544 RepID=W9WCQ0_9EURO|nr:uncharacterized protein A1O7_03224 [Cladophialophora yegresii CBS 114405]EXJ62785.1 hypothetical protein A1O7_03224 [Cladophialophora yegresii CBS 114405]
MSRNLYFLFKDDLMNVEDIDAMYPAMASGSVIADTARPFYVNVLRPRNVSRVLDAALVSAVWRAIQWRTTSHADDETLAVATIFGISRTDLEDCVATQSSTRAEKRMELFLQHLPDIPGGLIFMAGTRPRTPGFRWAPATWMPTEQQDYPDPLSTSSCARYPRGFSITTAHSVLTGHDLLVRYPGYRLRQLERPRSFCTEGQFTSQSFLASLSLVDWYVIRDRWDREEGFEEEVMARLDEDSAQGDFAVMHDPASNSALLVLIYGEEDSYLRCESLG